MPRLRQRTFFFLLAGIVLAVIIFANAHLVYVATMSQPDCVPHVKADGSPVPEGAYTVAQSAC